MTARFPAHTMTTYFILDRQNNTWSDAHYPLSSILATPGITEGHILANARTQETLTVAQARNRTQQTLQKPKLAAQPNRAVKTPVNKTLTMGMTFNREKSAAKPGSHMSLSAIPKKADREYKVISQNDRIFNGQFNAQSLHQVLNNHAKKGWRVISCTTAPVYAEDGSERHEMMIVLEKGTA